MRYPKSNVIEESKVVKRKCIVCLSYKDSLNFSEFNFTRGGSCKECDKVGRTIPAFLEVDLKKMRQVVVSIEKSTLGKCAFCEVLLLKHSSLLAHFKGSNVYCDTCYLLNRHLDTFTLRDVENFCK